MRFRDAVVATPGLSTACRSGLQALHESDRKRIKCLKTRRLAGSVNLEEALSAVRQNEPIWDYGIGWQMNGASDWAIWVEVHPANSLHVDDMIKKVNWLRRWLLASAPRLKAITRPQDSYVWLASGRVALQRNSPQARRIALAGIAFPRQPLLLQ